ncbi:MAG: HlyD family efflux transporter periplasmic adaptor subunit [Muribaculaceae bacterium]|nr:HlyD family efflux transporter periplasmic adaptor subunit [Muribaculaceae bacterium]
MDRKIPDKEIRRRRVRSALRVGLPALLLCAGLWWLLGSLGGSSVSAAMLRTAVVERGDIEATVSASGRVVPAFEQVITSSINSHVLDVCCRVGDEVEEGTPLLLLDLRGARVEADARADRVRMRRLELERQLAADNTALGQLEMQIKVGAMKVHRLEAELANERYLDSIGSGTTDKVRQAEYALRSAVLEQEQLQRQLADERSSRTAAAAVTRMDIEIMAKEADMAARTLGDAEVRAPHRATVTEIVDKIGGVVTQGQQLAVVADLGHYKVEAEAADGFASAIRPGSHAMVRLSGTDLEGVVGSVSPTSASGVIVFTVTLANDSSAALRAGLRPQVYVAEGKATDVLRIANGSYYSTPGNYELFVLDSGGKSLTRRRVRLGCASADYVEVESGLAEGETVVTADMSKYANKKTLNIR